MEWRSDAPPKDGTWLILFEPFADEEEGENSTRWIARFSHYHAAWFDQDGVIVMREDDPTHWMLLSSPPKTGD